MPITREFLHNYYAKAVVDDIGDIPDLVSQLESHLSGLQTAWQPCERVTEVPAPHRMEETLFRCRQQLEHLDQLTSSGSGLDNVQASFKLRRHVDSGRDSYIGM